VVASQPMPASAHSPCVPSNRLFVMPRKIIDHQIIQLSEQENALIINAPTEYGNIFQNAHDLVYLTGHFISNIKPDGHVFSLFIPQVQKALTLSLLSCLRNHEVQLNMMLRYALESAVLAGYALNNPNLDDFCYTDSRNCLCPKEKAKDAAYKWINNNFPSFSDKIKYMKDSINESFAHANILSTPQNYSLSKTEIRSLFFDIPDALITKKNLWWIANISFGLLDLLSRVIEKHPLVSLANDFPEKMKRYYGENEKIKEQLAAEPRLEWCKDAY
jgi:hypothetical protein